MLLEDPSYHSRDQQQVLKDVRKRVELICAVAQPATSSMSSMEPLQHAGSVHELSTDDLLLSGHLLHSAITGITFYGRSDSQSLRMYAWYIDWRVRYVLYVFVCINLALPIFEAPNGSLGLMAPVWVTVTLDILCMIAFSARLIHMWYAWTAAKFWNDKKNWALMGMILVRMALVGVNSPSLTVKLHRHLRDHHPSRNRGGRLCALLSSISANLPLRVERFSTGQIRE